MLDEWAACGIEQAADIKRLFVDPFYFGCEADDPLTSTAFNESVNPFGARLHAMMGSDIAHWDVPDMTEVLEEAWEMVDHGWINPADFREFTFVNPVRFYTGTNPDYFKGTVVERRGRPVPGRATEMIDLALAGATVVDGTGAARYVANVGIDGGRVATITTEPVDAREIIDVTGRVVCPGFIDIHTHYDAQLLWDPTASPSTLHGVTTVLGGNCGFSVAPLGPGGAEYVQQMMARVEGMSPRVAPRRRVMGLADLRRVPGAPRRPPRRERGVPRRPLDAPTRR